jgi:hypothetical protein
MTMARLVILAHVAALLAACPGSTPTVDTVGSDASTSNDPDTTTSGSTSSGTSEDTAVESSETTTLDPSTSGSSEESSTGPGPECGNDIVDPGEECDLGSSQLMCDADCTLPVCGDGFENFPAGEYCDPGDAGETARCNADCTLAMCGDMVINAAAGETCDDGPEGSLECNTNCTAVFCGDGVVSEQADEECDDVGESMTCDADCTFAECGDATLNATAGEACDDGPDGSPTCDDNCQIADCGDGLVSPPFEQCDDAGESAACDADCTLADCGDGQINATAGEICDEGGETVGCDDDCTPVLCGDGNPNFAAGEICDDANANPDDGCDNCFADCGQDCWSETGCLTDAGRCIRFTCTDGASSETACDECFGWQPITYDNWLNEGYCEDVSATYRLVQGYATACGGAPLCCSDPDGCGGFDNAWHFNNGVDNYYVGPCLGCMGQDNCTFWNNVDNGNYSRITACIR